VGDKERDVDGANKGANRSESKLTCAPNSSCSACQFQLTPEGSSSPSGVSFWARGEFFHLKKISSNLLRKFSIFSSICLFSSFLFLYLHLVAVKNNVSFGE